MYKMCLGVVLASFLTLAPGSAQVPGGGLTPPGNCTAAQHRKLQNDVNRYCKTAPASCNREMSCADIDRNWRRAERCANARQRINKKCYAGGDAGHKTAEAMYRRAASLCRKIYKKKCE